jgi:hypothetical protein
MCPFAAFRKTKFGFVFFIFIKAEGLQVDQLKLACGSDFLLDDRCGFFKVYRLNFSVV